MFKGSIEMWTEDFFHKHTQVALVEDLINPDYFMVNLIPEVSTPEPVAVEIIDGPSGSPTRAIDDPLKKRAPLRTESSEFHPIRVSGISKKVYGMDQIGFKMVFESNLREMEYIDLVTRTHLRAAEWVMAQFNDEILERLVNNFSLTEDGNNTLAIDHCDGLSYAASSGGANGIIYGEIDEDYKWDQPDADPLHVLSKLRVQMKKQGSGVSSNMDTVIMDADLYSDIIDSLERTDYRWSLVPWGGRSSLVIPKFHNIRIVEANEYDGFSENYIMCMDSKKRPGVTFRYDKQEGGFSKWSKNSRFWSHQFMDNHTHDLITQMWTRRRTVSQNKTALAVLKVK